MTEPSLFYPGDEESLVTPSGALGSRKKQHRFRPLVVATFHKGMFSLLRMISSPLAWRKWGLAGAEVCNPPRREHTLMLCPVGASGTVLALENAIQLGARHVLFLGWCGSLSESCPIAHVVVPTSAVREEGTSYHYLPPSEQPEASRRLIDPIVTVLRQDGIPHTTGTVWSTDAPYRETPGKVHRYAREGVLAVDMESSAILALAAYRSIEAAGALIVSDELFTESWKPAWRTHPVFRRRLTSLARCMVRCCDRLANGHKV